MAEKKFKKATEEDSDEVIVESLVDNVKNHLFTNIEDIKQSLITGLYECESPIEQLLAIDINRLHITEIRLYNPFINVIDVLNQVEIKANNKNYRVDFMIGTEYKIRERTHFVTFVIECDGFKYHSSQASMQADYERTRDLQLEGYYVIKFTGGEIFKSSYKCAKFILNCILNKYKSFLESEVI